MRPWIGNPIAAGKAVNFTSKYEVLFVNPVTSCPTPVCFTLPCGCVKNVRVSRRQVTFDYGTSQVTIKFRIITGRTVVIA